MTPSIGSPALWVGFTVMVVAVLALDLGVLHRRSRPTTVRQAGLFTLAMVSLALLFCLGVYLQAGKERALQFLAGYLVEEALSVDNLFVFLVIFNYFRVPEQHQHRVLFWGVFGALAMRAVFIAAGSALVSTFHWVFYAFGVFLLFTGGKLLLQSDDDVHPEQNFLIRLYQRFVPTTETDHGSKFFVRENGKILATPLLLVLFVVEVSDIIFAVDSIPAIFAVTTDPFLVYTSNVFAILGLRSMYFVLAKMMQKFHYLRYGLGVVLGLIGVKMLVHDVFQVSTVVSLAVIVATLAASVAASVIFQPQSEA